jgi:V/A-type H+/Na+-transporting ATPase subunit F
MAKETKIAFVGDKMSIEFFRGLGIDVFPVSTVQEAKEKVRNINFSHYTKVIITEDVFDRRVFERELMEKKILVIPGLKAAEKKGYKLIQELIKKATGMKE